MQITYGSSITQLQITQVLGLAKENYVDLANKVIDPILPTKDICITTLQVEIGIYLKEMLNSQFNLPVSIALATTEQGEIAGFTLVMQSSSRRDACGILYCVVDEKYRKQGLTRAMFDLIKNQFSSIALSCNIRTVPLYEKLGFRVTGPKAVQVAMIYGPIDDAPAMSIIDVSKHGHVQKSLNKFMTTHSIQRAKEIEKSIEENQTAGVRQVKEFLTSRGVS